MKIEICDNAKQVLIFLILSISIVITVLILAAYS